MPEELKIPTTLDERAAEALYVRDPHTGQTVPDAELQHLAHAMKTARTIAERSRELADTLRRDRTLTPPARSLKLKQSVLGAAERGTQALDSAFERLTTEIARIEAETHSPHASRHHSSTTVAGEVRSRLASMQPEARRDAITKAIAADDDTVTAAVLGAPALLVGMTEAELESIRLTYRQKRHPVAFERLNRLKQAKDRAERAGQGFLSFTKAIATDAEAYMAERAQAATDAALANLSKADLEA